MPQILVSGLINIETSLKVDGFPIPYFPVCYPFNAVDSTVSGVGYNIAKALTTLGNQVTLLSVIGEDIAAQQVLAVLEANHISSKNILNLMAKTAQSVILYDPKGQRQIHVDLKDIQEKNYPIHIFEREMVHSDLLAICNINFSRPFLKSAVQAGKMIATDVHTIHTLQDDYNRDFLHASNILFMSDESLPCSPEDWARQVLQVYGTDIIVIGLGADGALLSVREDHFLERIPALKTLPVINTIGAGDALFSAFLHIYARSMDPYEAIQKAVVFAAHKIGASGAAEGFLDHNGLEKLYRETRS